MKKVLLFIFLSVFLISCASIKSITFLDIIPDDNTNAVIFLKDHRLGNYNKQEYYYLDDIDEIRSIFSEWKDLKKIPVFPRFFEKSRKPAQKLKSLVFFRLFSGKAGKPERKLKNLMFFELTTV